MDKIKEMGEAPLGRLLLKFSLPAIAIMVVNGLYNFIDRIFIGNGMGTDALAAVTAGFPMMIIAMAVGALFSVGTSTLVSIAMGADERDEAASVLGQGFAASLVSSLAVDGARMDLHGSHPESVRHHRPHHADGPRIPRHRHDRLRLPDHLDGSRQQPPLAKPAADRHDLHDLGHGPQRDPRPPLHFRVPLGYRRRRLGHRHRPEPRRRPYLLLHPGPQERPQDRGPRLAPKAKTILEMLKLGIPIAIVQCLSLVMLVVANNAMSRAGGETALAVIGIVNALSMLLIFPIVGIAQGATALWGFNYGAGKLDRVRSLTKLTLVWTSRPRRTLHRRPRALYPPARRRLQPPRPGAHRPRHPRHRDFMLAFFTSGIQYTASMFFMSIGKAAQGGALYMAKNILPIAGMALLPLAMGINGVFWTGPISDLASTLLSVIFLASRPQKPQSQTGRGPP